MSLQNPEYSSNPILSGVEHVGHALHVSEEFVVNHLPNYIKVAENAQEQAPDIVKQVSTVVQDVKNLEPLEAAIAEAIAVKGLDITEDAALLTAFKTALPTLEKMFADTKIVLATISQDITTDTEAFA
jgi:hypothetical protein